MPQYSPERRTALVLAGTGAHGAYHAGVLRALQEAGVKIDVVAGHGVGAAGAALAAIDGGSRLWEPDGVWRGPGIANAYPWRLPLRVAAWLTAALLPVLAVPLLLLAARQPVLPRVGYIAAILAASIVGVLLAADIAATRRSAKRSARGARWWRLAGAPIDAGPARELFADAIWQLIRGAAPRARPPDAALGRRYAEVLADNLGQPGFRELLIVVHDLDTHRDVIGALLRDPYRRSFAARRQGRERPSEALDLAGLGHDHGIDLVAAALTPSFAAEPHLVTFGTDSFWRGETHRMCDRAGAVARVFEELAAADVAQTVVVSAVPAPVGPHTLIAPRLEPRHRFGEVIVSTEAAALRDAFEQGASRGDASYLICPSHNPLGPFDFDGAYDEASDRRQTVLELMERGYEDAYRQFIEPIVGASGEHLAQGHVHGQGIFNDADSSR